MSFIYQNTVRDDTTPNKSGQVVLNWLKNFDLAELDDLIYHLIEMDRYSRLDDFDSYQWHYDKFKLMARLISPAPKKNM